MKQISLFYAENVLKMRKMRKSANYADPHHRILSDALCRVENRAKIAQNGTVLGSQLANASQNAIFFSTLQISIVLLYYVQGLVGKGRFLATKRAQKRECIVCLASAAILPFFVTSPDIQFWLSAELNIFCIYFVFFYIQLFRERLSERSIKVHATRPKGIHWNFAY